MSIKTIGASQFETQCDMLQSLSAPICIAGRYDILLVGDCAPDLVRNVYDASNTPTLSSAQREVLRSIVKDRLRSGKRIDRETDGSYPPLYRLRDYAIDPDGGVTLSTGRTNYPEYLATNVEHPEWRSFYGSDVMSDALAFSVVLVSSDGLALLGRRSWRLADRGGEFHVLPSGHPHPPASIFEGVYAELSEETGVEPSEVSATVCTGLVRTRRNSKPGSCPIVGGNWFSA